MNTIIKRTSRKEYVREIFDSIPEDEMIVMAVRLYSLCALAWDYVDTILDTVVRLRISETKPLVRKIRELRRDYDRFRNSSMGCIETEREMNNGLELEEEVSKDLELLNYSLFNDISRMKLTDEHRNLVIAVQQAMTMLDAVRIYARQCDAALESHGLPHIDCAMVQGELLALYPLIPQFAGDCYRAGIQARAVVAHNIVRRLNESTIIHQETKRRIS